MRRITFAMIVCTALAGTWALAAPQGQDKASPDRVRELLGKLASDKFADRERAMKELEALGPAALPALRPALKSEDAEVRRRVETLVRKFEDQELATKLLTGKPVRIVLKDGTVSDAFSQIAKQSGYQVSVAPSDIAERKGTLDTGNTTFWEALHQLCVKAGLEETSATAPAAKPKPRAKVAGGVLDMGKSSGIQLTTGKASQAPTCFAGSVRIRVVKTTVSPTGETDLTLEVAGEPRLLGFAASAAPRVDKAVDDQGQSLTSLLVPLPVPAAPAVANNGVGNGGVGNGQGNGIGNGNIGNGVFIGGGTSSPSGFKPFLVTLRLKAGEKPAKKLVEVSGKLPVQTQIDAEPVMAMDNILKAAGQTAKGKDGSSLTVRKVEQLANGDVRIDVAMDNVPGQNALGAAGGVRIQAANIQINGQNIVIGGMANPLGVNSSLHLLDAKGQDFTAVGMPSSGININGGQISQTMTLVFRPTAGQGPATRLVLPGYRSFAFEVPFTLKDVPLP